MAGNLANATTDLRCANPGDLSRDAHMAASSSTSGSADVSELPVHSHAERAFRLSSDDGPKIGVGVRC